MHSMVNTTVGSTDSSFRGEKPRAWPIWVAAPAPDYVSVSLYLTLGV
jgi:hypothetical protein